MGPARLAAYAREVNAVIVSARKWYRRVRENGSGGKWIDYLLRIGIESEMRVAATRRLAIEAESRSSNLFVAAGCQQLLWALHIRDTDKRASLRELGILREMWVDNDTGAAVVRDLRTQWKRQRADQQLVQGAVPPQPPWTHGVEYFERRRLLLEGGAACTDGAILEDGQQRLACDPLWHHFSSRNNGPWANPASAPCTATRGIFGGRYHSCAAMRGERPLRDADGGPPRYFAQFSSPYSFAPESCTLDADPTTWRARVAAALAGGTVRFIGTSRTRYMYLFFVRWLRNEVDSLANEPDYAVGGFDVTGLKWHDPKRTVCNKAAVAGTVHGCGQCAHHYPDVADESAPCDVPPAEHALHHKGVIYESRRAVIIHNHSEAEGSDRPGGGGTTGRNSSTIEATFDFFQDLLGLRWRHPGELARMLDAAGNRDFFVVSNTQWARREGVDNVALTLGDELYEACGSRVAPCLAWQVATFVNQTRAFRARGGTIIYMTTVEACEWTDKANALRAFCAGSSQVYEDAVLLDAVLTHARDEPNFFVMDRLPTTVGLGTVHTHDSKHYRANVIHVWINLLAQIIMGVGERRND
jgi:hypothetical protein